MTPADGLDPEQRAAVLASRGPVCVLASAGTGCRAEDGSHGQLRGLGGSGERNRLPGTCTGREPRARSQRLESVLCGRDPGRQADCSGRTHDDALDGGPARGYREDVTGWLPVAGDFDGDGSGSVGLFSAGTFRLRDREGGPVRLVGFGGRGDLPVVGDWDGNGKADVGVYRTKSSVGSWRQKRGTATTVFSWGRPGDMPLVGNFGGDRKEEVGVRRLGKTAFVLRSATNGRIEMTAGRSTDAPASAALRRRVVPGSAAGSGPGRAPDCAARAAPGRARTAAASRPSSPWRRRRSG